MWSTLSQLWNMKHSDPSEGSVRGVGGKRAVLIAMCLSVAPCFAMGAQDPKAKPIGDDRLLKEAPVAPVPQEKRITAPKIVRLGTTLPSDETLRAIIIAPKVLELLDQMGDSKWSVRQAATDELHELPVADEVLLAVLLQQELDVEQRARVIDVIARRITEAPRGALGIRMRRVIGQNQGVIVEALLDGLPARKFLKVGDRIVGLDGYAVNSSEDLTAIVQSKTPGDNIKVDVMRNQVDAQGARVVGADGRPRQEEISFTFPLGSVDQLTASGGVSASTRVVAARLRVVQLIQARFSDRPIRIRTPRVLAEDDAYLDRSADTHPSVVWLRRRLELMQIGLAEFDIDTRREATQRLTELMVDAQDEERSPAERAWIERVLKRYIELVPTN